MSENSSLGFSQSPPSLGNQYTDDRVLRAFLARALPPELLNDAEDDLRQLGALAGGELFEQQLAELDREPTLEHWDAWGNRIDHIALTPLWEKARTLAATYGLVATGYEGRYQPHGRIVQFALAYLFHPSTDIYTCPLAMTDGAARALLDAGNQELIARAVCRLTSRDPDQFWTSGQWMTETTGGSDVSATETVARRGDDGRWRLTGRKWFTSAATSEMALTLARPEGNPGGGAGLAMFYLEPRDEQGRLRNISILRLKDKLGTRKLPTAELHLDGALAEPVAGLDGGVKRIAPMLNITRTWNAVCAVSYMRRGIALARDYANRRVAFNRPLAEQPLHVRTLADLQAEFEGAFGLTFHMIRLLGLAENGQLDDAGQARLRLLVPIAKLLTGKQAVAVCSEVLEAFGGAGYVEDTGLPALLRDAQVLPIWEGTTNVLSLDLLRVLAKDETALVRLLETAAAYCGKATDERLKPALEVFRTGRETIGRMLDQAIAWDEEAWQAVARDLAMGVGRLYALALLIEQGQHAVSKQGDPRTIHAAVRYARRTRIELNRPDLDGERALGTDIYV